MAKEPKHPPAPKPGDGHNKLFLDHLARRIVEDWNSGIQQLAMGQIGMLDTYAAAYVTSAVLVSLPSNLQHVFLQRLVEKL